MNEERPIENEQRATETVTGETTPLPHHLPERIGRYHIKRVIASGGMGIVYEATQENPRRVVAVKVMKQGIASKSALRRFEYESQLLARLRHPGIAQIYEAGTHTFDQNRNDQNRDSHGAVLGSVPFFAMEYIPNAKTITKYADEKKLGTRQRMELFVKVCDAVHHGHQKGIIHRDLKPGNILVDSHGEAKVIDFGVARGTDSDMAVTTLQTDIGQLIGTLQYMSPEQCEGDPHDIDTRSDVYALGVVLYELLSGKLPYDVSRSKIFDGTRMIREQQPTKLGTMDTALRGDVETIALKALEKDRDRRFQSAVEFAQDIRRYLSGEAITARPPSIIYQLRIFARRNKAVFASLSAVFVILFIGVVVSTSLYFRAESARQRAILAEQDQSRERERAEREAESARRERDKAEKFADFMVQTLEGVGPSVALGRDTKMLKELMGAAGKRIQRGEISAVPEAEVRLRVTIGKIYREIAEFDSAEEMLMPAIVLAERVYGSQSAEYANAISEQAEWLHLKGRWPEALAKIEETLAIRQCLFPGDHPSVAKSLHQLAELLFWRLERPAEGLPKIQEALAMSQRLYPGDHPDVATNLDDLANCLYFLGRSAEALPKYEEGLAMRKRLFPGNHPDVATSLHNLPLCLVQLGRPAEALPMHEESLALAKRLWPADHPHVATSLNNVADCLVSLDRPIEALPMYEQSLAMTQRLFPGDHLDVAYHLNKVAFCLDSLGRSAEALTKFEEALAMRRRYFAPGHQAIAVTQIGLGSALGQNGRFAEGEALMVPAWEVIVNRADVSLNWKRRCLHCFIRLYESWDAAEPNKGYAEKAAEWRAKLPSENTQP